MPEPSVRLPDFTMLQKINDCSSSPVGVPTVLKRRKAEIDAGEWAWFRFSSRVNVRWVPQGDGIFECQFLVSFLPCICSTLMVGPNVDYSKDPPGLG
jgi:hypothetical protein